MIAGQQSRTAQYVAFFRALETCRPAETRLFADPLAESFLDAGLRAAVAASRLPVVGRAVPWLVDRQVPGPRLSAVARTRLIDDTLLHALADGVQQVVILGAGYDTRAYRLPALRRVRVIEIDHPDTQAVKRSIIQRELGTTGAHVSFVPIDFDRQSLADIVTDGDLARGVATFILWEGVASYLSPAAVDATVRWARDVAGPNSQLMLTYVHRGLIEGTQQFPHAGAWVRSVQRAGEPFVFGFNPCELPEYLTDRGWQLTDDLSTPEALVEYGLPPTGVPSFYRVAHAAYHPADQSA